jgi:hypothetical protein
MKFFHGLYSPKEGNRNKLSNHFSEIKKKKNHSCKMATNKEQRKYCFKISKPFVIHMLRKRLFCCSMAPHGH